MDKKLTRSVNDKMIGGVCGGIAQYFNMDPSLVRIGFAMLTLIGGGFIGIIAYIVMLIVVPEETAVETAGSAKVPATTKTPAKKTAAKPKPTKK